MPDDLHLVTMPKNSMCVWCFRDIVPGSGYLLSVGLVHVSCKYKAVQYVCRTRYLRPHVFWSVGW